MPKWHLIEVAKKYNLPITVILTSLAICNQISSQIDEIDEFEDSMEENWNVHDISRVLPSNCTIETVFDKFKTNIGKYMVFNRLSLPTTIIIVLLSCKIHNMPPLVPRTLPGSKFSRKNLTTREISEQTKTPSEQNQVGTKDALAAIFDDETDLITQDTSKCATLQNIHLSQEQTELENKKMDESKTPCHELKGQKSETVKNEKQPIIHTDEKNLNCILDIETHIRIETKILNTLNFQLTVPDTASIMIDIGDKLMFTSEKNVKILEKLLSVHLDGRIKQFEYFAKFISDNGTDYRSKYTQEGHSSSSLSQESSHNTDSAIFQSKSQNEYTGSTTSSQESQIGSDQIRVEFEQVDKKAQWKRSPIDVIIETHDASCKQPLKSPVTRYSPCDGSDIVLNSKSNNVAGTLSKEHSVVSESTEYVLAYNPEYANSDEAISKSNSQSFDKFHSNVIDCCLALLDEEDLIRYEITMGENRSEKVQEIKKIFHEYMKSV